MTKIDNWRNADGRTADQFAGLRAAIAAGPTGGRWRWEINMNNKRLHLVGGAGREFDLTIMDFDRWGMGNAVATLRDTSIDGMNIMHRLPDRKDWIAPFPGRAHHADWCQQVTHPDMKWIEEANPATIRTLLDEHDRLVGEAAVMRDLLREAHGVIKTVQAESPEEADLLAELLRGMEQAIVPNYGDKR